MSGPPLGRPRAPFGTIALMLVMAVLVAASFATLPLQWAALFTPEAARTTAEFLQGFARPEMSPAFLWKVAQGTAETLSMSALSTAIAALLGLILSVPAAGRAGPVLRVAIRLVLNVARSIPELVWAAILLIAAGLGPFAGTLALAAHTAGVLGRLFADTLENCPPLPEASLRINGTRALPAFLYATLPQCLPQMMSYSLYRWENNIRAAAVLGVVGAGGLGQSLKYHLSLFHMSQAATIILAMLLLVALVDAASLLARRAMMR